MSKLNRFAIGAMKYIGCIALGIFIAVAIEYGIHRDVIIGCAVSVTLIHMPKICKEVDYELQ